MIYQLDRITFVTKQASRLSAAILIHRIVIFTRCAISSGGLTVPGPPGPPCCTHIRRQRKPITISVYKHCFLEEARVSGCMRSTHQDGMPSSFPPRPLSPVRFSLRCAKLWLKTPADTSCMSPSCKRGVTRLTSIVLVDGHAYRTTDRWAGDDKEPVRGHRDGHALRYLASRLPR